MKNHSSRKRILLVDKQGGWRENAATILRDRGFAVRVLDNYESRLLIEEELPDLLILGCYYIKHEEREFINLVLKHKIHLLVLCASLPWTDVRPLFLAGAEDVTDKPYDPNSLVIIVNEVFSNMTAKDSFRERNQGRL